MNVDAYHKKLILLGTAACLLFALLLFLVFYLRSGRKITIQPLPLRPADVETVYPSKIIDLSGWKLTLPTQSGSKLILTNIQQPKLENYQMAPWFRLSEDEKGVAFRAPVNAKTTENSDYPRSELREMTDSGADEAFWPSTTGVHTLFIEQAITAVPKNKPDVVAGQIHGDDDDLIVIRLEHPKLFVARGRSNLHTLDENYVLGKKFTIKFVASGGEIKVFYNNSLEPVYTLEKKVEMAYFKVGVYTQSNCETEDDENLCSSDNYGEVVVYRVDLTHK